MSVGDRIAVVTFGCKVNQVESDQIARELSAPTGGAVPDDADLVVINTCTVTAEADRKVRKAVRHALALPQAPKVLVTGCLAAVDPDGLRALGERVVVEPDKTRVPALVRELAGVRGEDAAPLASADAAPPAPAAAQSAPVPARARVQVKVEDGCDAYCAYCIVPLARGVPRPVPLEDVVAEVARLASEGVAEVVLTGINIGRYLDRGRDLADVLEAVCATGVPRVRLSSVEPAHVTERLLSVAAGSEAFCSHLHVPLQSGSDAVLRAMNRPYTTAGYAEVVKRARVALPGLALSTDVIVGHPGETDEDFEESLRFVERMAFSRLHVFRYSPRPGTPAASMDGRVAPGIVARRAERMRELGDVLAGRYAAACAGTTAELLVERALAGGEGVEGTTREYLRASLGTYVAPGTLVRVVLEGAGPNGVLAARLAT